MGPRAARTVAKPWGHEEIFAETASYVGKILFIRAGEALSLRAAERVAIDDRRWHARVDTELTDLCGIGARAGGAVRVAGVVVRRRRQQP